jgi:hypothetical protein
MTDEERLARVGRALASLGRDEHVRSARAYFVDVRAGHAPRGWTRDLVVQWAQDLRIACFSRASPDESGHVRLTSTVRYRVQRATRLEAASCIG